MAYDHLLKELKLLSAFDAAEDFFHIGPRPLSPSEARRKGLTHIASHPALAAKLAGAASRRIADRMADDPFSWGSDCNPGRYSRGFAALYTSKDLATGQAERGHHITLRNGATNGKRPKYLILSGRLSGRAKNLHDMAGPLQTQLIHDSNYRPTQAVGAAARAEPVDYLVVPSARVAGVNFPVFARAAVSATRVSEQIVFYVNKSGTLDSEITGLPKRAARRRA